MGGWKHYPSSIESLKKHKIVSACAGDGFSIFLSDVGVVFTCGDNSQDCLGHIDTKYFQQCTPLGMSFIY